MSKRERVSRRDRWRSESSAVQNGYRRTVYFNLNTYILHHALRKTDCLAKLFGVNAAIEKRKFVVECLELMLRMRKYETVLYTRYGYVLCCTLQYTVQGFFVSRFYPASGHREQKMAELLQANDSANGPFTITMHFFTDCQYCTNSSGCYLNFHDSVYILFYNYVQLRVSFE